MRDYKQGNPGFIIVLAGVAKAWVLLSDTCLIYAALLNFCNLSGAHYNTSPLLCTN